MYIKGKKFLAVNFILSRDSFIKEYQLQNVHRILDKNHYTLQQACVSIPKKPTSGGPKSVS